MGTTSHALLVTGSLAWREMIRFLRQPSRLVGALATPVVFWWFLGSGMGSSFRAPAELGGGDYLAYFFPGALALTVLFASIFSAISVIEDRSTGFLQGVLVAPVGAFPVILGKVAGGALLATFQGALFLPFAPLAGVSLSVPSAALALGWMALLSVGLTGIGFFFAWQIDSVQGYHGVMNLILMPMWLLSGALFPAAGASRWLVPLIAANPMTYGVAGMRQALSGDPSSGAHHAMANLGVLAAFAAATLFASRWAMARRARSGR